MLILSEGYLFVFTKFLQIFLWISLPAIFIAMLITTIMHYKNKKRKKITASENDADHDNTPLQGLSDKGNDIVHQLYYSNAKCIALRKDFETLEEKYATLLTSFNTISGNSKNDSMENLQKELQQTLQEQINNIQQQHKAEKDELQAQVDELNEILLNLRDENISLQQQLDIHSTDDTKVSAVINKWEDEKYEMKRRLGEQEYLRDVLDEKKYYIDFLQKQLEQRIKNHHLVEQQFRDLGIKFLEVKEALEKKEQNDEEFNSALNTKDKEINSLQEIILAKTDHTTQLENSLANIEEERSKLVADLEGKEQKIKSLKEQLENYNEMKSQMEDKLEKNQQVFKGFHRKLSDILDSNSASPVVLMKTVYQASEESQFNETATQ
jgi:chromosome segregation ATPase